MTKVTYNVPLVLVPQNNSSSTAKTSIIVKDCSNFSDPDSDCLGFNFNRCPNDASYCQPFIQGDLIYGQFKYDKNTYRVLSMQIINSKTGANFYSSSFVTVQSGFDPLNNSYYTYVIDTSNAAFDTVECWYVELTVSPLQGGDSVYYATEPYCPVQCNEPTLLVVGEYPQGYDCFGGYYGAVNNNLENLLPIYKPSFRIRGWIESDNFDFEKTVVKNKTQKSKQFERFLFITKGLPYYVTRQLAVAFNSKSVTIDGQVYEGTIKLSKNNDEGSLWYIRETIFLECDDRNFTCE